VSLVFPSRAPCGKLATPGRRDWPISSETRANPCWWAFPGCTKNRCSDRLRLFLSRLARTTLCKVSQRRCATVRRDAHLSQRFRSAAV